MSASLELEEDWRQSSTMASTPAEEGEASSSSMFVQHKVTKLDTLAGLAIKYNASVGDIKRCNGLLSDSAMYGRDIILIPTMQLPLGQELQNLVAQVLTGASRDPVLHADANAQPASAAAARIATSLNMVNGHSYPDDLPVSECAMLTIAQFANCGGYGMDYLHEHSVHAGRAGSEVELADRSSEGAYMAPASSATARHADAVRRRRNMLDDGRSVSDSAEDYGYGGSLPTSKLSREGGGGTAASYGFAGSRFGAYAASSTGSADANSRVKTWFSDLGKAIGDSVQQTVAKVKEAANQPALARPSMSTSSGFGSAADNVLGSMSKVSYRKPNATLGRAPFDATSALAAAPPPRPKVSKAD